MPLAVRVRLPTDRPGCSGAASFSASDHRAKVGQCRRARRIIRQTTRLDSVMNIRSLANTFVHENEYFMFTNCPARRNE